MATTQRDYVTIVSGLPRSGTSMMMQMIDRGGIPVLTDDVRKADEDNPKGYYEFEPVKRTKKDPSWVERAQGKVVKMVHLLLLDMPTAHKYRVVFMKRNIQEVVASQNIMLERQGKSTGDLSEQKLVEMFQAQMAKVDKYVHEHPNFEILYVLYNDVLKEPAPSVQAVNAFLGGDLDTDAMLAAVDPALYRNRR